MIRIATDAGEINRLANDPSIRPFIGYPDHGPLDFADVVACSRNIVLIAEGGAVTFVPCGPRRYEAHVMFRPEVRGRRALETCREMLALMFRAEADEILAPCPIRNRRAVALAVRLGMRLRGYVSRPLDGSPFLIYSLRRQDWVN